MRWLQVISRQICVKIETAVKATLLLFGCVLPGGINNLIKLMFSVKPRGTGAGSNYTNPANDPKTQPNDLSAVENISKTEQRSLTRMCYLLTRTAVNLLLLNAQV